MLDDWYTLEESRALLYYIFPNWPDMRGMRPVPDRVEWLAEYRRNSRERIETQRDQ
jgi:hypothetical protein